MDQGSAQDDRPYLRPQQSSWLWPSVFVVAAVGVAGAFYYYTAGQQTQLPQPKPAAPQPSVAAAPPAPAAQAPVRLPVEAPADEPLPTLDNSDSMMRRSLSALMGKAFDEAVNPSQVVRRIVATVDNLPRQTAPRRMMPLNQVPGNLIAAGTADAATIDPRNFERYAPYVRVMESVDSHALVYSYVRAYPLFQQAYEELGYPGKYFNDRLLEAIDDMLAAPESDAPIRVLRPKVLYEYADPELETRSAGQKIMIRVGKENETRMKAKLREIRSEILAASRRAH